MTSSSYILSQPVLLFTLVLHNNSISLVSATCLLCHFVTFAPKLLRLPNTRTRVFFIPPIQEQDHSSPPIIFLQRSRKGFHMPNNPEDLETPQITQNPLDLTSIKYSTASTTSQSPSLLPTNPMSIPAPQSSRKHFLLTSLKNLKMQFDK